MPAVEPAVAAEKRGVAVATDATRPAAARELVDSLLLFGLTATGIGAYVGIAFAAVRLLGAK
jgi:hypothetical protein